MEKTRFFTEEHEQPDRQGEERENETQEHMNWGFLFPLSVGRSSSSSVEALSFKHECSLL